MAWPSCSFRSRRAARPRESRRSSPALGESCLVLRNDQPAGFVTSIARSPTLGLTIGMAYAHPEDARPDAVLRLRDRNGKVLSARVVSHAFYDPDNARQDM